MMKTRHSMEVTDRLMFSDFPAHKHGFWGNLHHEIDHFLFAEAEPK